MKQQLKKLWRGSLAPVSVGVVSAVLLTSATVGVQAAQASSGTTAADGVSARAGSGHTVLKNEYGKAKSRIVGTFGKNGTVEGTFMPKKFKVSDTGVLKAVGVLSATLVRGNGTVVGETTERVKIPVLLPEAAPTMRTASLATCDILNLVLAPLDLDLLGLQVHLDKVVLNIVAESGAGNLLGNLLCAVAGLLDQTGTLSGLLTQVSQILNSILAILQL